MCDSTGLAIQKRDLFEMENIQMREMSKAIEVTKHVWVKRSRSTVLLINIV
jgi:hypothetical protein